MLLEMLQIVKTFPGVQALRGVDLHLNAGEVVALLGENGAGKSTLMKILSGAQTADSGTIRIQGHPLELRCPQDARRAGVAMIHQEFSLIPALSGADNLFLGQEQTTWGFLKRRREFLHAKNLLNQLGADFDPARPCRELSTAQQQLLEIAKAMVSESQIMVMDEPTATLSRREAEHLFEVVEELRRRGLGIIYISHRLDEIRRIADRVVILRDGQNVGGGPADSLDRSEIIRMMVGRELRDEYPPRKSETTENTGMGSSNQSTPVLRLSVENLGRAENVPPVSFNLQAGEILALTGLAGAGRTEIARLIFGADPADTGRIVIDGEERQIRSPRDAMAAGIGFLTEDRKTQGLVLKHSVRHNYSLPNLSRLSAFGWVQRRTERSELEQFVSALTIRIPGIEESAGNLSGGNQQKVVLARWLGRHCDILIFDEPTRGIDVGARHEIYQLMRRLAEEGKSILMISSELPEVLGMADRILVVRSGAIVGEFRSPQTTTQEDIMKLAIA